MNVNTRSLNRGVAFVLFIALVILILGALSSCKTTPTEPPKEPDSPDTAPSHIPPSDGDSVDVLLAVAGNSSCAKINWRDRGRAPLAYVKGMALVYAKSLCREDEVSDLLSKKRDLPESKADGYDALSWYNSNFNRLGLKNDTSGPSTLKNLYALAIGFGMRESSGKYCEGRDQSASWTASDTAEAGMFQTSWNAASSTRGLGLELLRYYQRNPSKCLTHVFKQGVSCSSYDAKNFGSGTGLEYQKLAKSCPAFATEFAMLTLRTIRKHYGPINRKEVELKLECHAMLTQVERIVNENQDICRSL